MLALNRVDLWSLLAGLCALATIAGGDPSSGSLNQQPSIHTVITTECSQYFSWQTIGIAFTHRRVGQPGPLTRLMCCTEEDYGRLSEADRQLEDEVATHLAPSYSVHPKTGDVYPGINKAVAVLDWLTKVDVREDFILIADADMIMRAPILPQELGAKPGWAVSGFYGYLCGVNNELALRHVPHVVPREDTLAGPEGRRGDQVGGFSLMLREDLQRVAPLWLKFSEDVREDPLAWNLTCDAFAVEGQKPWIAEMYGYSFACAAADVWHVTAGTAMMYPGYEASAAHLIDAPKVLHYGILWQVAGSSYSFDKHWHYDFDALACPPWHMSSDPRETHRGLFAHPPRPSSFNTTGAALFRDLLAIEVIVRLNQAFCERHRKNCPPSGELERECGTAEALARELDDAYASLDLAEALQQLAIEWESIGGSDAPEGEGDALAARADETEHAVDGEQLEMLAQEINAVEEDRLAEAEDAVAADEGRSEL